jgi:hypothetical protein
MEGKMRYKTRVVAIVAVALAMTLGAPSARAQDGSHAGHAMDHSAHMAMPAPGKLGRLDRVPDSGRAREAGSDGRYAMESTTVEASLATRCAQASRGLIMLDNAGWKACGGKPKGAPTGPKPAPAMHGGHAGHNM